MPQIVESAENPVAVFNMLQTKGSPDGLDWCAARLPTPSSRPEEMEATRAREVDEPEWCAAKLPMPRQADLSKNQASAEDADSSASYDSWKRETPPLKLNHDALKHIASYFLPGNRGKCLDITTLQRGAFHEIRELHFEDGSTCIGRFTRGKNEHLSVLESETATVNYVRQHTSIRVPEIYFINRDPEHVVGAAFVIMEKLPGRHLYCFWEQLSLKHKLSVIESITGVLAQLIGLEFGAIGSLTSGGTIGPLLDFAYPEDEGACCGPFDNTLDYMLSFTKSGRPLSTSLAKQYSDVRNIIRAFMQQDGSNPIYHGPYRMIHGDFDAQNMLFEWDDGEESPRLSGIIDWDHSHSGPLYYLCEYPIFIQDVDFSSEVKFWRQNKILRKFFVQKLAAHFPPGSHMRFQVKESFRQKNQTMNPFSSMFMGRLWPSEEAEASALECYVKCHDLDSTEAYYYGKAYGGKPFWEADSEMGSDDDVEEVENDGIGGDSGDESGEDIDTDSEEDSQVKENAAE
jgi:hypothetical protein